MKWTALGFFAGIAILLGTLSVSYVLAFVGFLVMLATALAFERNARHLGKTGIQQITQRRGDVRDELGSFGQRMRERFRRDTESEDD